MCLAQRHNAATPVRLEPAAPRSGVKHSTTEPLRSQEDNIVGEELIDMLKYVPVFFSDRKMTRQTLQIQVTSEKDPRS